MMTREHVNHLCPMNELCVSSCHGHSHHLCVYIPTHKALDTAPWLAEVHLTLAGNFTLT